MRTATSTVFIFINKYGYLGFKSSHTYLCVVLTPQHAKTSNFWIFHWPSSLLDYKFAFCLRLLGFRYHGLTYQQQEQIYWQPELRTPKAFYAHESVPPKSPFSYKLSAEWLPIIIFLIFQCIYITGLQQLAHMNSRLSVFLISVAATYPLFFNPGLNETSSSETNLHND